MIEIASLTSKMNGRCVCSAGFSGTSRPYMDFDLIFTIHFASRAVRAAICISSYASKHF